MTKASDTQVGGDHYKAMGDFQPWDVLKHWLTPEEYRGYQKGVAIAYLARERSKGGAQDIAKAAHHLQKLVEVLGDDPSLEIDPRTLYGGGAAADLAGGLPIIDQPTGAAACSGGSAGWIEWRGGEWLLPLTTHVEFRTALGQQDTALAGEVDWAHRKDAHNIVAYRIIDPTTN